MKRRYSVPVLVVTITLGVSSSSIGQSRVLPPKPPARPSPHWLWLEDSRAPFDRNSTINSWPVDPFMTASREAEILAALNRPYEIKKAAPVTVADIAELIARRVPTVIDHRSLEEYGLTANQELIGGTDSPRRTTLGSEAIPFSSSPATTSGDAPESGPPPGKRSSRSGTDSPVPWWRHAPRGNDARDIRLRQPLGEILRLLQRYEMTLQVKAGTVVISSEEAANERLTNRVYDITPLVDRRVADETHGLRAASAFPTASASRNPRHRPVPPDSVEKILAIVQEHVTVDAWNVVGGMSSASVFRHVDKYGMVVSAPSTTHWEIQALLDRLHQMIAARRTAR